MSLKFFYEFYKETTHSEMIILGVMKPRDQTKTGFLLSILSTQILSHPTVRDMARDGTVWY